MIITFVISALILAWIALTYNSLVKQRNIVKEAWSGIDVQLKRRYDLIPNVVDSVKGYAGYEKELLQRITAMRTKTMQLNTPGEKVKPESEL
ncbi:MAG TPA: LemA family protein, partial [Ignavibacteriaceae bacterium]